VITRSSTSYRCPPWLYKSLLYALSLDPPDDDDIYPITLSLPTKFSAPSRSMWGQLGVLGSRVVEAVFVSKDAEKSKGRGVGTVTVVAVMEGNDVKTLIAKRLGISKDQVDARLIALHNKGELAGTADRGRPKAGPSGHGKSPTLTKKDLEDFEASEAKSGTPFKSFKPTVLGATPRTPRTPPDAYARPPTTEPKDDEVEVLSQPQAQPPSGKSDWSEEMDEEEALPLPVPVPAPMDQAKSEGSGGGTVGAMEGDAWQDPAKSEGSGGGGTVGAMEGSKVWQEPRKRYVEAVEAEHLFSAIEAIEVPLLDQDDLGIDQLQYVVRDLVGQVNKAHKLLATAGYVVAERSRESHQ
jgi:hypothetical protein